MVERIRKILKVFEHHGLWDQGVELIGSWCFYLYQRHLGVKAYPLKTQDIDFLLPDPYRRKVRINLIEELKVLGFHHDFRPDGSIYLWDAELRIEFMVPERGRGSEHAKDVKSLGVRAISLRFMDMLLDHPITLIEGGIHVTVPDPTAFCLHKLLIAPRRKRVESRLKDWEQALHVASILKRARLLQIYRELPKPWQRTIVKSLTSAAHNVPLLSVEAEQLAATLHTSV